MPSGTFQIRMDPSWGPSASAARPSGEKATAATPPLCPANARYDPVSGRGDAAGTSTGSYRLRVGRLASPGDPDDPIAEARPAAVGAATPADSIDSGTDVDFYRVTVSGGDVLTLEHRPVRQPAGFRPPPLRFLRAAVGDER